MKPETEFLERECVIIEWLHRQLVNRCSLISFTSLTSFRNQDPAPPSLDCFQEGMIQTIGQIYEQRMLPKFTMPYFSDNFHAEETWLLSVTFPPLDHGLQKRYLASDNIIPPYNIRHHIQSHSTLNNYDRFWSDRIKASCKITAIVEELSPINRVECYTHFLEYHLLTYARYFHRLIDRHLYSPVLRDVGGDYYGLNSFALWFSYAYPSTKILVGLWTLRYLLRRVKPKWHPPVGFCSGAISYLEVRFLKIYFLHTSHWFLNTQKYSLDPTGELHSWLEGLLIESSTNSDDFEGAEDFEDSEDAEDEQEAHIDES